MFGSQQFVDDHSYEEIAAIEAAEAQAHGTTLSLIQTFYAASRRARKRANDTWVQVEALFKQLRDHLGPLDLEAMRRCDVLKEHIATESTEAKALLEVLKALDPAHARDVANAVEAEVRAQWNNPEVKAARMKTIKALFD